MQHAEEILRDPEATPADAILLARWTALNALYGVWDPDRREPVSDKRRLPEFVSKILELDADGRAAEVLRAHKPLVIKILEDPYLTKHFWEEPCEERANGSDRAAMRARSWYVEGKDWHLLYRTLERIYLLRCQLVHGAATCGGRLNRVATRRCATMLGHVLPAVLLVVIDHGAAEDWGPLCYPPQS